MSDPSHNSSVHGNHNTQEPIDVHATLAKNSQAISRLREMITKYIQTQESKTHRSRNKHGEG